MLEMPQMIQTWKEVRSNCLPLHTLKQILTSTTERTWTWVEEVAKINGSPIRFGREIVQHVTSTVSRVFIAIAGRMALYWEVSCGWMSIVRIVECVIMNVCRL